MAFHPRWFPLTSTPARSVRCTAVDWCRTSAARVMLLMPHLMAPNLSRPDASRRACSAFAHGWARGVLKCLSGFSVNRSPSGATGFEAQCLATGGYEFSDECRDTDWCLVTPTCGIHGACVDGHLNYTCDCESRFEATATSDTSSGETCEEMNECDVWSGAAACSPGSCTNLINRFTCACPTGYRSVADHGNDVCEREVYRTSGRACKSQRHV